MLFLTSNNIQNQIWYPLHLHQPPPRTHLPLPSVIMPNPHFQKRYEKLYDTTLPHMCFHFDNPLLPSQSLGNLNSACLFQGNPNHICVLT